MLNNKIMSQKILNLLFLVITFSTVAQTPHYQFEDFVMSYQELDNPISINNNEVWGETNYVVPVNVNFKLFGKPLESITVKLSDTNAPSTHPMSLLDFYPNWADDGHEFFIFPHNFIIKDRSHIDSINSISPVTYQTIQIEDQNVQVFEWKNIGIKDHSDAILNYQIWLYDNSDMIEYHYGYSFISSALMEATELRVGLRSSYGMGYGEYLSLHGDGDDPIYVWSIAFICGIIGDLNSFPSEGMVYRFYPHYAIGLEENLSSTSIYPNPTSDILNIKNENLIKELVITDISGKEIKRFNCDSKESTLDISELDKGIYLIGIRTDKKWSWEKIVKQ